MIGVRGVRLNSCHARRNWRFGQFARYALLSAVFIFALFLSVSVAEPALAEAGSGTQNLEVNLPRAAVGSPNVRVFTGYAFSHVDKTETTAGGSGSSSTLRIGALDVHAGLAEVIGTIPLTYSTGLRGIVRGSYDVTERDLDPSDTRNEDEDSGSYGVGLQAFVRNPDLGSLTAGASFDQISGLDGVDATEFGASAAAAIFVPNLGAGPIDYGIRFDYAHQELDGTGQSFNVDLDLYTVTGEVGWYLTNDIQLAIGGRWHRLDDEFLTVDDSEGMLNARWLLPVPISVQLSIGGSVGESRYKESPYPSDDRLIYGANLGLTFRFFSGKTLIENVRAFD